MTASWTDNGENVVGLYVTMSEINSTVFNTQVQLEKKDNVYYKEFSAEEKKAITTYVSKHNINKLSSTAVYAVSTNGETVSKDATVFFEITT